METNYKITIPKPCHENWDKMMPNESGRFCGSCAKSVIDFTQMKSSEIQEYFIMNQGKSICGRFKNQQLDSIIIKIPSQVLFSQVHFHKMFLLALLVSMGTTLFSCADKNGNKQKIDGVEVVTYTINNDGGAMVGEIAPYNDSLNQLKPPAPKCKIDEVKFVTLKDKKHEVNVIKENHENVISGMVIPAPEENIKDSIK
jgi:hypothetical protein